MVTLKRPPPKPPTPGCLKRRGQRRGRMGPPTPKPQAPCGQHAQEKPKKKKKLALTQSQSRLRANRAAMLAEGKDVDVLSQ